MERSRSAENVQRSTLNAQPSIAEILAILRKWGIATLGELAALDREELRARLGNEAVRLWERANGTAMRLLKLMQPPETFEEAFEFDHEIETAEPLLFMLRRFLEQLALRLGGIYLVARELTLTIHFSKSCHDESVATATNASTARTFKIPQPTNDVDLLFRMLQTHLENFKSKQPIIGVALSAEPVRPVSQQFGLFETALRDPRQLFETLARLTALLGADRVGTPVKEETHRPDAFRMEAFAWRRNDECRMTRAGLALNDEWDTTARVPPVAFRRFRSPNKAALFTSQDRHLQSDAVAGQIVDQAGPFLLSGNWWDEKAWARAEWDMELEGGEVVRAHDAEGAWKVDGVYD